jgi:DNA-directed RNA polymerase specialized sigma24 family protein
LLVHGFDWSYADVAELLEINQTAVNNHLNRGLARLRASVTDPNSPIVGLEPS